MPEFRGIRHGPALGWTPRKRSGVRGFPTPKWAFLRLKGDSKRGSGEEGTGFSSFGPKPAQFGPCPHLRWVRMCRRIREKRSEIPEELRERGEGNG